MRPQQQNRRMRGRNNSGGGGGNNNNNNNRKGPNPLTRNYESNGPDVKIRGSAQQIAEKYTALARDAQSASDRVMSENYLQHAEHYNRIIAAAQAQMPIQQIQNVRDDIDEDGDDEQFAGFEGGGINGNVNGNGESHVPQHANQQPQAALGSGPQPVIEGVPAEVALNQSNGGHNAGGRNRDRRPHPAAAPDAQAQDTEQAASVQSDESGQSRRGRRPRRGERNRGAEASGELALSQPSGDGQPAQTSDGAAALAAFEN